MSQVKSKYMVRSKPSDLEGLKTKQADLAGLDFKLVDLTSLDLRGSDSLVYIVIFLKGVDYTPP